MAEVKNYGLSGVHRTLQLGKQGPVLVGNADTDSFTVTLQDAATLTTMAGANASSPEHFVTKAQLDSVSADALVSNVSYSNTTITMGTIAAGTKTVQTVITVNNAYDGNTVLQVGTDSDNSLLVSAAYYDLTATGDYVIVNTLEFATDTEIKIFNTPGNSTTGDSTVVVSVLDGPVTGSSAGGGSGTSGITDIVQDTSPQLGGNLDLNGNEINGTGNVNILGQITLASGGTGLQLYGNYIATGDVNTDLILTSDDSTNWIQIPGSTNAAAGNEFTIANEEVNGVIALKAGSTYLKYYANGNLNVPGNITAANFEGNINITGNVVGTSTNVELVAGNYTYTFDNTGELTLPTVGGDEGGQINLGIPQTNTTLQNKVNIDVYRNQLRIYEGSANAQGVSLDLSKAPTGVGGELAWKVSALVDAGELVTMDNIKVAVTTGGNRGLGVGAVSGSFISHVSGWYGLSSAGNGASAEDITYTTTLSSSAFGWSFPVAGATAQYNILDKTNSRFYRITMMINHGYVDNFICIERLY